MKVIITGTTGYVGMWNRMSEVAEAMIAVANNGYHKPAIECRDI